MLHDNEYHDDINYGNRFPNDWYFQEDNSQQEDDRIKLEIPR